MAITRYRGFSTIDQFKKFRLTDLELIKRDLLNHFAIRKGEKLMNPEFGSIIWNILFEPLSADVKALVVEDIQRVVSYDPRVRVDNVLIDQFEYGLQVQVEMTFLPDDLSDENLLLLSQICDVISIVAASRQKGDEEANQLIKLPPSESFGNGTSSELVLVIP
jgi:phage baseplate assembly protein W